MQTHFLFSQRNLKILNYALLHVGFWENDQSFKESLTSIHFSFSYYLVNTTMVVFKKKQLENHWRYLSYSPLDQWSTSLRCSIHFLKVVLRVRQVLCYHVLTNVFSINIYSFCIPDIARNTCMSTVTFTQNCKAIDVLNNGFKISSDTCNRKDNVINDSTLEAVNFRSS